MMMPGFRKEHRFLGMVFNGAICPSDGEGYFQEVLINTVGIKTRSECDSVTVGEGAGQKKDSCE